MSLKDQVTADLPTFLNVGEFGVSIVIDGAAVTCVLVNDEAPTDFEGVSVLESTLYARGVDFAQGPVVRQRMTVDGRQANVMRIDDNQGMLTIKLRWYNS